MKEPDIIEASGTAAGVLRSLSHPHRRTLEMTFHHPLAHNLEWRDVVALIADIGEVEEKASNEFVFEVADHRHIMRKPHTKNLTTSEVMEVRHFLERAGLSPKPVPEANAPSAPSAPALLIAVDHHEVQIFHVDVSSDDISLHATLPHDSQNLPRHLHNEQSGEQEPRAPDDPDFYESIATAIALGGNIVIVGHGAGNGNAAHHLAAHLKNHHVETYRRIVGELTADLSYITPPQLLNLARQSLRS
ncbi:hypothetical protein [Ancylobacter lacus]|uniref:hypothetical protein n=1 Tax=Ancylobacter lacus TaxID=2579970 RepID=UPI001BCDEED1|nr:hypothetical protein [Ancylobacter lacus]MBS7541182.1 hypothetical protein [Ancylobacter lacus]